MAFLILVAFAAGYVLKNQSAGAERLRWIPIVNARDIFSGQANDDPRPTVQWSNEVFQRTDLPAPEFESVKGRARILPSWDGKPMHALGFVVTIQSKPLKRKTGELLHVQAQYSAQLELQLLDADGFVIKPLTYDGFTFFSGTEFTIQGQTGANIPEAAARQIHSVGIIINVDKLLYSSEPQP